MTRQARADELKRSYAVVEDVPASWEHYARFARSVDRRPAGLVLHVAGPTDEGFRIIEVWETEDDWRRSDAPTEVSETQARAIVRDLHAVHVVVGTSRRPSLRPRSER